MRHIIPLSATPELADTLVPEVKLTFIRNILNIGIDQELIEDTLIRDLISASIPLFVNKNPQNPL